MWIVECRVSLVWLTKGLSAKALTHCIISGGSKNWIWMSAKRQHTPQCSVGLHGWQPHSPVAHLNVLALLVLLVLLVH